jgi:hypothetical protein
MRAGLVLCVSAHTALRFGPERHGDFAGRKPPSLRRGSCGVLATRSGGRPGGKDRVLRGPGRDPSRLSELTAAAEHGLQPLGHPPGERQILALPQ